MLSLTLSSCGVFSSDTTEPAPEPVAAIADGEWFAMVIVGEDETAEMTLGVDLAEMLSGQAAIDAAIEDGFIGEGEDLPNDFYIRNPDLVYELLHLADEPQIVVLSGDDPSRGVLIDRSQLAELYEGTYVGEPVYGVVPHEPMPMNVTVRRGEITVASMVYLP